MIGSYTKKDVEKNVLEYLTCYGDIVDPLKLYIDMENEFGYPQADVRSAVWSLNDQGKVFFTLTWAITTRKEEINSNRTFTVVVKRVAEQYEN